MTIEEKIEELEELWNPMALKQCLAMLKKSIKQRNEALSACKWQYELPAMNAELLRAGEGT